MTTAAIVHPKLGVIKSMGHKNDQWTTDPLPIGAFGYIVPIEVSTVGGDPNERQISAMVSIYQATPEFRELVADCMLEQYTQWERPSYRKQIGDTRYTKVLKESDLPELSHPVGIWTLINGMLPVLIDEDSNLSLAFKTTFDAEHDFAVRFRGGKLYEVMMDG